MRPTAAALLIGLLALAACTSAGEAAHGRPGGTTPSPTASEAPPSAPRVASTPAASTRPARAAAVRTPRPTATSATVRPAARPTVAEPTTTNTLPPPPAPSRPAPSTAGPLSGRTLPVPAGWHRVVRAGGSEEGYDGNGSWVHARDPRYAAQAVLTLGCADVTRDDYPDPVAALEGTYERRRGEPGIGLVLQFASRNDAAMFYRVYLSQVRACRTPDNPVVIQTLTSPLGLIDRRTAPDADWTEVGRLTGSRLTLIILTDPGHQRSRATSEALLRQIHA